tara:strand:+ start:625 stop:951 length:327 start_codon:yes stop_codon:yes gene_type:complete
MLDERKREPSYFSGSFIFAPPKGNLSNRRFLVVAENFQRVFYGFSPADTSNYSELAGSLIVRELGEDEERPVTQESDPFLYAKIAKAFARKSIHRNPSNYDSGLVSKL